MKDLKTTDLIELAAAVPSYTDNYELVQELARRLEILEAEIGSLPKDDVAVAITFYAHRRQFADVIQGLLDWIRSEYSWRDIELPPEYIQAERMLKEIPE